MQYRRAQRLQVEVDVHAQGRMVRAELFHSHGGGFTNEVEKTEIGRTPVGHHKTGNGRALFLSGLQPRPTAVLLVQTEHLNCADEVVVLVVRQDAPHQVVDVVEMDEEAKERNGSYLVRGDELLTGEQAIRVPCALD